MNILTIITSSVITFFVLLFFSLWRSHSTTIMLHRIDEEKINDKMGNDEKES